MKGYVKIHRELLEHPIWTSEKFTRGQAWADLILKANAKPGWLRKRGVRIDYERGDVAYSIKELSRQWDWSESKTRRFLNELEDDGMVTLKKTNVSCTITLVNYDMWQSDEWQMRRGDYSSNGAQSNEQTTRKRYPNNKENKRIRKKEESEKAHTTLDLNPFLIKYPRNDVEYSYERFKLNQQKKGVKSDDVTAEAAAFEMWLMSDLKYEKNLRAPEVNKKVTRHCPNKHGFVEVLAKDEYKGVFCEKCDYQMVHVSELVKSELLPF
jgi:hypothetical protein